MSQQVKDTLYVPYKRCMECKLFGGTFDKQAITHDCTAANGNSMCPAEYVTIELGAPVDTVAAQIVAATKADDSAALGTLYTKLARRPQYVQDLVKAKVEALSNKEVKK